MDKELRKLSRKDLLEIIYEQKKRELELNETVERLKKELQERQDDIETCGSIAEATLKIHGIFEAAQECADDFVSAAGRLEEKARQKYSQTEAECLQMIEEARKEAKAILNQAERKSGTDSECEEQDQVFQENNAENCDTSPESKENQ